MPEPDDPDLDLAAMLSYGSLAAHFTAEAETWPVFIEYLARKHNPAAPKLSRDTALYLSHQLAKMALMGAQDVLDEMRRRYQ